MNVFYKKRKKNQYANTDFTLHRFTPYFVNVNIQNEIIKTNSILYSKHRILYF